MENYKIQLDEVSMLKCARIMRYVRWVGTEVCDLLTYDGLPKLDSFLTDLKEKVFELQHLLSLDVVLKATPASWWVSHKQSI